MLRIKEIRKSKKVTAKQIADHVNVAESTMSLYENGKREPDYITLLKIAEFLDVSVDCILGKDDAAHASQQVTELNHQNVYMIPVYKNAAAGFGALAIDSVVDRTPLYIRSSSEAAETICVKVTGDSMYPKIENGDIVQVHKQTSVDSGSIAVVLLDGDEGLVKKIMYGPDWIQLQSINPMYPPMIFEGPDVMRIQVVGLVKKVIKEI